jgi:ketosteroid isomerase-like protein
MRNSLFLLFTILCLSLVSQAQSGSTFQDKVQKAHQSFIDAILVEDYRQVDQLMADDVTLGFPHGGFTPKQEYVNGLKSKTLYYDSSANQKLNVRVYGNTGVVNGTGDLVFRYKDEGEWYKMLEHLSFTAVYVLDKDKVKMVSWQSNRPTSDSTVKVTQ